jgi:hypothetical protein
MVHWFPCIAEFGYGSLVSLLSKTLTLFCLSNIFHFLKIIQDKQFER